MSYFLMLEYESILSPFEKPLFPRIRRISKPSALNYAWTYKLKITDIFFVALIFENILPE